MRERASRAGTAPSATGAMSRLAFARAKAAGVALEPLLKASDLTLQQMQDLRVRIPVRSQIKFLKAVADAVEDDYLGFHLAQQFDLKQVGLLYYVMASSDNLADALERGARYSTIVNEGIASKFTIGSDVSMMLSYVGVSRHLDRHQIEFWVTAILRVCRGLTGLRLFPSRLRLTHLRKRVSAEFTEFFGDGVEFGASTDEIAFTKKAGDLPVVSADSHLNSVLVKYCEEALSQKPSHSGSFRSSVENAIVPLLPHGRAQAAEVARRLGVSQTTFARRLASERLTFTSVLESLRFDLAKRYLAEESLSISEVAWLLGYREVSAFSHAFKRWTGHTPRTARSQLAS